MGIYENKKILNDEERQNLFTQINNIDNEIADIEKDINYHYTIEYEHTREEIDEFNTFPDFEEEQIQFLHQKKQKLERKIFEDDYWRKNEKYTFDYEKSIAKYSLGCVVSDTEHNISRDVFERKQFAKTIAEVLCKTENQGPFNVGILGRWGQGKTTFIEYIRESIMQDDETSRIRLIDYNASEYDEQQQIWARLANQLFEEYEKDVLFAELKFYIAKIRSNSKAFLRKSLLKLTIIIVVFILTVISKELFSFENIIGYFTGASIGISAIIIAICKVVIPLFQSAISSSIRLSDKIIGKIKLPNYVEVLGKRAEISTDLENLFKAWLNDKNDKVIIFVDELDRCSEKGIVEFFQSIQLLTSNKKLNFIFAIDVKCLKNAFMKYKGVPKEEIDEYIESFLDKYVSLTVPLYNVYDYSKYIDDIVHHIIPVEEKECFTKTEIETIKRSINAMPKNSLTPRKVKKIINILICLKDYCVRNINGQYAIKFEEFITWYIFAHVFSDVANAIITMHEDEIKYAPLGYVINKSNIKMIEENPWCKNYLLYMKDYAMSDINLYNLISHYFMPDIGIGSTEI